MPVKEGDIMQHSSRRKSRGRRDPWGGGQRPQSSSLLAQAEAPHMSSPERMGTSEGFPAREYDEYTRS